MGTLYVLARTSASSHRSRLLRIYQASDFDSILQSLRKDGLVWAVRVGSASCSRRSVGVQSTTFGLNAENPDFKRTTSEVWNGTLERVYQATYVAHFAGSRRATVFTVYRSVGPNGEVSSGAWQNGSKPIVHYFLWSVLVGFLAVLFFEVVRLLSKKSSRVAKQPHQVLVCPVTVHLRSSTDLHYCE